jgi:hypothetical protein
MLMTMTAPPSPAMPPPPFAPRPDLLYQHDAAVAAWHALCANMGYAHHHPTIAFHVTDADNWSFELIQWPPTQGQEASAAQPGAYTYTIRVTDEEGHVVGYL